MIVAKSNEQIMDDLADDMAKAADMDVDTSIFDGQGEVQADVLKTIYLIEAYQAGTDPLVAKLSYRAEDMKMLPATERMSRLTNAIIFADNWRAKRAA